jgi:hypothetical protein
MIDRQQAYDSDRAQIQQFEVLLTPSPPHTNSPHNEEKCPNRNRQTICYVDAFNEGIQHHLKIDQPESRWIDRGEVRKYAGFEQNMIVIKIVAQPRSVAEAESQ